MPPSPELAHAGPSGINDPPITWGRYYTAALAYIAVTITGWCLLANTPDLLDDLSQQAKVEDSVSHHRSYRAGLVAVERMVC